MIPVTSVVLVIIGTCIVGWFELRSMSKSRKYKEMAIFTVLMTASSTFFSMELLEVKLPNPLLGLIILFDPVSKAIFAMLS